MAVKNTNATIVAIKKEASFKEVITYTDAEVVGFDSFSFTPQTESLARQFVNAKSGLSSAAVQGSQTSSGSISIEVLPDATDSKKLAGHVLYEAVMGDYTALGATITATDIVDHKAAADGTDGLYSFSDMSTGTDSLGVKYVIGGDEASSMDIRGVVATQWKINFPSQGIIKSDFTLEGSTGFIPVNQGTGLTPFCSSITPYIAKSMTLNIGGVSVCATDVSLTVTSNMQDVKCIKDNGVSAKVLTTRKIEGSMTLIFEDASEINAYNSWGTTDLFLLAENAEGKQLAIKLNNIRKTSLDLGNDNSVITQSVSFEAYDTCGSTTPAILVASK
jgi:hypothetical protein